MNIHSLDDFNNILKNDNKLYIWGTGVYGDLLGKYFNHNNICWYGYYDNFSYKSQDLLNGKPIYNGAVLPSGENTIFILSMRNSEAVYSQLIEHGISDEYIIVPDDINFFNNLNHTVSYNKEKSERIKKFYNIHSHKRCFIIGNGPSLITDDLEIIRKYGEFSFGSNMIFNCFDKTMWRPDYYFFTDPNVIRNAVKDTKMINYITNECKAFFTRNNVDENTLSNMPQEKIYLLNQAYSSSENSFSFSEDCSKQLYIGYTVSYVMIQMAVYMGFKEIYLLGMDHSFSKEFNEKGEIVKCDSIKNHADILGNYKMDGVANIIKSTLAFETAKKYADEHGIKIYNATRGGKLEVFERVSFDKLFYNEGNN